MRRLILLAALTAVSLFTLSATAQAATITGTVATPTFVSNSQLQEHNSTLTGTSSDGSDILYDQEPMVEYDGVYHVLGADNLCNPLTVFPALANSVWPNSWLTSLEGDYASGTSHTFGSTTWDMSDYGYVPGQGSCVQALGDVHCYNWKNSIEILKELGGSFDDDFETPTTITYKTSGILQHTQNNCNRLNGSTTHVINTSAYGTNATPSMAWTY